jgi:hypothetical protein
MVYYVTSLSKKNKSTISVEIIKSIPTLMEKWSNKENINDWEDLTNNHLMVLKFLNKRFLTDHNGLFNKHCNGLNVFKVKAIVTDKCGRQSLKKYDEILAADYHTIDVWQEQETSRFNKNFRYDNAIPSWQRTMNIRQYDRSNDGLHASNPVRASLNNQIHGYDMSNIIKGSTNYENYYYNNL